MKRHQGHEGRSQGRLRRAVADLHVDEPRARKVRQALGDTAENPTFVETVPGRGYRFIAGVELVRPAADALPPIAAPDAESPAHVPRAAPSSSRPACSACSAS
ncbi:MAG: hypothetical protein IT177_21630 [Acidobacteria bacterium]|nr:hypothetical protein [Acidobacteriota bacterium]